MIATGRSKRISTRRRRSRQGEEHWDNYKTLSTRIVERLSMSRRDYCNKYMRSDIDEEKRQGEAN